MVAAVVGVALGPLVARLTLVLPTSDRIGPSLRQLRWTAGLREVICGALCAALFGLAALRWGADWRLLPHLCLFATLVTVSVIDVEHYRIPDRITFPALGGAALVIPAVSVFDRGPSPTPAVAVAAAALGALSFGGGLAFAHLIYPRGMGLGDVKLAVLLGAFLGWSGAGVGDGLLLVLAALLLASFAGSVVGVAVLVVRRRSDAFPFGPALALGTVVALLAAPGLLP